MSGGDLSSVVRDHSTEAHFMAADGRLLVERVKQVPEYVELFQQVFNSEPLFSKILDAIAAYVWSLNSPRSRFEEFQAGQTDAISADAAIGWQLFQGKAGCIRCHSGSRSGMRASMISMRPTRLDGWTTPSGKSLSAGSFASLGFGATRACGTMWSGWWSGLMNAIVVGFARRVCERLLARLPTCTMAGLATLEDVVRFYNGGGGPEQRAELQPLEFTTRNNRSWSNS